MSEKYKNLKVKELQELLQKNGIPHSGKKEDLIERLVKHDERKALENLEKELELDDLDDEKLLDSALLPINLEKTTYYTKESVLSDEEDDDEFGPIVETKKPVESKPKVVEPVTVTSNMKIAAAATTTASAAITADKKVTEKEATSSTTTSTFKFTPITFEKKTPAPTTTPSTAKKPVSTAAPEKKAITVTKAVAKPSTTTTTNTTKSASPVKTPPPPPAAAAAVKPTSPATAISSLAIKEKKGEPLATTRKSLDEQAEKLRLEAERKLERAKRFGIKLGDEDKKEIRAARFGIAKPAVTEPAAVTAAEVKKKTTPLKEKKLDPNQELLRKRAERFGIPEKKIALVDDNNEQKGKNKRARRNTITSPTIASKNKTNVKPANKKATVPINRVQQGRIAKKPAAVVQNSTTKKVLNKKKGGAVAAAAAAANLVITRDTLKNKRNKLPAALVNQSKRNILNNPKVNIVNNNQQPQNGGRVITIASPSTTPNNKRSNAQANKRIVTPALNTNNGRIVMVANNNSNLNNNTTNNKRHRGRGGEPSAPNPHKRSRR